MGKNEKLFLGVLLEALISAEDEIKKVVKKSPTPLDDIALAIFFRAADYLLARLEKSLEEHK